MRVCDYTLEELRESLRRSSERTLITEGSDDYSLFRGIGVRVGIGDLLPVGGKNKALHLFTEADTFSCPRTGFLVDRDLWLFSGVPAEYVSSALVITDGYSIENDLLRDGNAESLIDDHDLESYRSHISLVIKWYAAGVTARQSGFDFKFDRSFGSLVEGDSLSPQALIDIETWPPDESLIHDIQDDYMRKLRGKTWLEVLKRYLCAPPKLIQHSPKALLEYGLRSGGPHSSRLIEALKETMT